MTNHKKSNSNSHSHSHSHDEYDWDKHTVSEYDGAANVNGGDYYTAGYVPDGEDP